MAVLEALKEAILSERRAAAFYETAAKNAGDAGVRSVFSTMAEEERGHARLLAKQWASAVQGGNFSAPSDEPMQPGAQDAIVSHAIRNGLLAAGFEAGAIAAAMALEERAIKFYGARAEVATDPNEKALYCWLATWEKGHLEFLAKMDDQLRETVWHDQNFWPLD
ncbi:MAG TPA: ferritin family protein [Spirochaetota bacterium]|nr:ferritin family protein [Spirochaetota bacterium]HPN82739.1 ferritin family protein [Spirochaetota bacterium]